MTADLPTRADMEEAIVDRMPERDEMAHAIAGAYADGLLMTRDDWLADHEAADEATMLAIVRILGTDDD